MPDVTVRSNEHLPDPDVETPYNERYATSWELNFDSQIDNTTTRKTTDTTEEIEAQELTAEQGQTTDNVEPLSSDLINLTNDVRDNPYVRRAPSIECPLIPVGHHLQLLDSIRQKLPKLI